ncbi:hypothetical protein AVEN_22387-1 [Araneus ventricosus]|uniref:Uncharacterized protein n=1 Tax=Araneus ventricosus TaxID=182803 RepID=A0A4Y2PY14_ARAVE|nr:hypothetical protein AVEN_22387-1 [Araneus ventricosus]
MSPVPDTITVPVPIGWALELCKTTNAAHAPPYLMPLQRPNRLDEHGLHEPEQNAPSRLIPLQYPPVLGLNGHGTIDTEPPPSPRA